jgi:hypothetical protein
LELDSDMFKKKKEDGMTIRKKNDEINMKSYQ